MTLLSQLEDVWKRCEASPALLSHLTHCSAKALLGTQSDLFDLVQFSSAALTTCIVSIDECDKEGLRLFTERLLSAVHLTSHQHFNSEDFHQSRYLDCIAAILSVWLDLTQSDVVWPKLWLYNHGSHQHILDTLLQCSNIRTEMIERALQQITSIPTIQLFLRYVLCLRHVTLPRYKLFAISNQPDLNLYRLWLIKNNIPSSIPVLELINTPKHDQHILSALCSASSYTLPSQSEQQPMVTDDVTHDVTPAVVEQPSEMMFFIDRGVPEPVETTEESAEKSVYVSALEDCETVEETVEETVPEKEEKSILNVTLEPFEPIVDEMPIKIKNEKTPKKHKACNNVMVIDGSSPRQTRSKRSKKEKAPAAEQTSEETAPEKMEVEGVMESTPVQETVVTPAVEAVQAEAVVEDTAPLAPAEEAIVKESPEATEPEATKPEATNPEATKPENVFAALDILAESAVVEAERIRAASEEEVEVKAKTPLEIAAETEAILDKAPDPEEVLDSTLTDPAPTLLSLTPHNISLLNEAVETAADDNASMTSSLRRSTRKRNSSAGSEVSIESVASRTRHRKKPVLDSVPELETIAEKEVKEEVVKEEVKEVVKSVKKKQTARKSGIPIPKVSSGSKSKKAKIETVVEEPVAKTPAPKEKSTTKKKARKLSNTEIVEETPQIKVTRTRSRKLDV